MLTKGKIEQFYKDVESLGLKRPVATIAEKTGFSKGNVSSYLNRKLTPSENFIESFYDNFKIVPREDHDSDPIKIIADLSGVIGEMQEKLIQLEARVTVATTTLALSVSNQTGKPIAYVSSEIQESIDKETGRLLAEQKKKQKGSLK